MSLQSEDFYFLSQFLLHPFCTAEHYHQRFKMPPCSCIDPMLASPDQLKLKYSWGFYTCCDWMERLLLACAMISP